MNLKVHSLAAVAAGMALIFASCSSSTKLSNATNGSSSTNTTTSTSTGTTVATAQVLAAAPSTITSLLNSDNDDSSSIENSSSVSTDSNDDTSSTMMAPSRSPSLTVSPSVQFYPCGLAAGCRLKGFSYSNSFGANSNFAGFTRGSSFVYSSAAPSSPDLATGDDNLLAVFLPNHPALGGAAAFVDETIANSATARVGLHPDATDLTTTDTTTTISMNGYREWREASKPENSYLKYSSTTTGFPASEVLPFTITSIVDTGSVTPSGTGASLSVTAADTTTTSFSDSKTRTETMAATYDVATSTLTATRDVTKRDGETVHTLLAYNDPNATPRCLLDDNGTVTTTRTFAPPPDITTTTTSDTTTSVVSTTNPPVSEVITETKSWDTTNGSKDILDYVMTYQDGTTKTKTLTRTVVSPLTCAERNGTVVTRTAGADYDGDAIVIDMSRMGDLYTLTSTKTLPDGSTVTKTENGQDKFHSVRIDMLDKLGNKIGYGVFESMAGTLEGKLKLRNASGVMESKKLSRDGGQNSTTITDDTSGS